MAEEAVVARLKAILSGDSSQLRRDLNRATQNLDAFSKRATQVGRTLTTRLTLPLVGIGVGAVKVAADFEKSMSKITALVGVAADEVASMEGQVRSMATTFGKSATEAADALFYITSAGLRGSTATDTLAASLKASAIGLGDTATIADLATSALNAYGSDVLSATQATDVMTAAVREGKLEASELAGSMGRVLPLSSAMGVSFNEVGAAFAALSRTGTNAAEAATQIRGILSSLLRPTKQAEEALTGMGLSSEGLRQQIQEEGLLSTLQTLADKFGDNEAAAASVFGNIRALSGVLDLMGANVATTEQIFANMADVTGTVDEAFSVMSDTASFQFSQAMAEVKESMLTLGQELMPMVTDAVGLVRGALEGLTNAFSGMSDGSKQMVVSLMGVAAIAGPVALGIGMISKALVALKNANPWVLGLTAAFTGLGIIMGEHYRQAQEARSRQEALTEEFKKAGDPAAILTDRLSDLADEIKRVRQEAEGGAEAIPDMIGTATLQGALSAEGVLDLFNGLGVSMEDLIPLLEDGSGELDNLVGAFLMMNPDDIRKQLDLLPAGYENLADSIRTALDAETDHSTEQVALAEDFRKVIEALRDTGNAFDDNKTKLEADAQALIDSGDIYRDFADLLGGDTVNSMLAMVEEGVPATEVLDAIADKADAALYSTRYYTYMANLAADANNRLASSGHTTVYSLEELVSGFMAGADAIGFTYQQVEILANSMAGIDGFTAAVGVELKTYGGDAVIRVIDELIKFQAEAMGADLLGGEGGLEYGPIGQLMRMKEALQAALSETGGGGGGGGASSAIDEVAKSAEEAQRQVDALSVAVANLGNSLVSQNFRNDLFGASPDEIADIFENIVEQMDSLGMITADTAPQIAAIGEKFKAAASAAEELAEATQALADAQDELDRRKQVVADLKDDYADFRKEFGVTGGQFKIAVKKTPLELALDSLEDAMPRLRDAQSNLENLKNQQSQYQTSVADMFKPQLSADANVMAQTQRLLGQARQFRDNIVALRDKGFPPDVIAEVVNAGLIGGAKLGSQLLKLGGGELQQFLSMRGEISRLGAETASIAADVVFGADIAGAEGEFEKQRALVDQLFKRAIAAAADEAKKQEKVVGDLKSALEAATAQMQTLVSNIQIELFNAFTNFLNKLDGQVKTLTGSPFNLTWDNSAINRLTNLISKVTDTPAPEQPSTGGGGSSSGGGSTSAPTPAPVMPTYTVVSGDGPIAIIKKLTGSTSGWSSKAKKLWQENGMWWKDNNNWQTIHAGQVLNVPALAKGGRARKGMPHLVGEMGAELFVPDSSGYVVPNHMLGGGGNQTVNVTINTHSGMRAEDIVREIERYTRRRGNLAIPTTSARRR